MKSDHVSLPLGRVKQSHTFIKESGTYCKLGAASQLNSGSSWYIQTKRTDTTAVDKVSQLQHTLQGSLNSTLFLL